VKVLIIDDDAGLRKSLSLILDDAGYEVIAIPFVIRLDREFVIRRAWEEATGNVRRVKLE